MLEYQKYIDRHFLRSIRNKNYTFSQRCLHFEKKKATEHSLAIRELKGQFFKSICTVSEEFNRDLLLESLSSHATLRHDEEVAKVNRAREVEESAFSRYSVAATVDNTTDASQSHLVVETAGQHDFASEEPEAKN